MNVATRAAGIALARRESMTLNDANVKITCRHGCLWLTERCGSEDIVLEPGQSHVSHAPGVVIEAFGELQRAGIRASPLEQPARDGAACDVRVAGDPAGHHAWTGGGPRSRPSRHRTGWA